MFSIIKSFILLCVFNCEKYYFPFPHYIIYAVNVKCFIRQEHAFITIPYERDVHTLLGIMLHVALCRPKRRVFYARQRVFYGIKKRKKPLRAFGGYDDWITLTATFSRMSFLERNIS